MLRRLLFIVPLAAVLVFVSCSGDKSTDTGGDESSDRTSPENLLEMFATAYMEKDLDAYAECLHEDYLFVFTPDVADSLGLPPNDPWWGKTEELNTAKSMFEDPDVTDISFSYELSEPWYSCTDVRDDSTYNGLCCRLDPLIEVNLSLDNQYDPILKFRVDSSWLDVMVVSDPYEDGLWCILRIQETLKWQLHPPVTSAVAATEATSWGNIKAMWH